MSEGKIIRADGESLACASAGLNRGVVVYCQRTGATLTESLATVTSNPARLLPRLKLSGELPPSEPANLITFRTEARELRVENIIAAAEPVDQILARNDSARKDLSEDARIEHWRKV